MWLSVVCVCVCVCVHVCVFPSGVCDSDNGGVSGSSADKDSGRRGLLWGESPHQVETLAHSQSLFCHIKNAITKEFSIIYGQTSCVNIILSFTVLKGSKV